MSKKYIKDGEDTYKIANASDFDMGIHVGDIMLRDSINILTV